MKPKLFKFLALLIVSVASTEVYAQTLLTYTVLQQPCNDDGKIAVSYTGTVLPPFDYHYSFNGNQIVHTNINSTSDILMNVPATIGYYNNGSNISYVTTWVVPAGSFTILGTVDAQMVQPFTYSRTATPAVCPALGSIQITGITGGTAPYSYAFIDLVTSQSYATNPANVSAGNYYGTVTDGAGCRVHFDSLVVDYQSPISLTYTGTTANCTNGTASVVITGGTLPYTYVWNNGANSSSINGLSQGYYSCVVTDAQGCYSNGWSNSYYVQQNPTINVNTTITNATCVQSNGGAYAFGSGGVSPYTYLWSNGLTTQSITGLSGNSSYKVIATDANGCKGSDYIYVSSTTPITVTYNASPSSCTSATGSATIIPTGGVAPYSVVWNTYPMASTGVSISGKSSGQYGFTVTDVNGCVRTGNVYIPPVSTLNANLYGGTVICPVTSGNLIISASGSNPPFTYAWSNGSTASAITSATLGSYNCVITDALGCSVTKSGSVHQISPINVGFSKTASSCIYTADGTAHAYPTGGAAPYSYIWNNGQTTQIATGLLTNDYYVDVTDANGCHNDDNDSHVFVNANLSNACYCTITGTVYADANSNCIKDAGENGVQNIQVHCSGLGYAYTNANGVYSFMAPTGTYTITESVQHTYPLASCQANNQVVSVNAASNCVSIINFANTILPIHDLHIITSSYFSNPIPGNPYQQRVIVQNDGTVTENNIQLGYEADGQITYNNSTPLAFVQQDAITYPNWYSVTSGFPSLGAGSSISTINNFSVPTNIPLGTQLNFNDSVAHATPINTTWLTDYTPWNNVENYQPTVIGSFDPNFKEVSPKGNGPEGYILRKDSTLNYVIHFQNEGTYFAQNIYVLDTLDSDLDWNTLHPGYSDYNYTTTVSENGVIRFDFKNIQLPWKSQYGNLMSSGMVSYSIKTKRNLAIGTQIKNTAAIFFDFNEPVITNTTLNTLDNVQHNVSVKEIGLKSDDVVLYPNPAQSVFTIRVQSTEKVDGLLSVTDINGRLVSERTVTLQEGNNAIQEDTNLESGIYFVQLKTNDAVVTKKIVIAK